jgi:hypothetical protein
MSATPTSNTLEDLVKALRLLTVFRTILSSLLANEAERAGLSREAKKALFDRINDETDAITKEDMGEGS